jgi:hypothetical protein
VWRISGYVHAKASVDAFYENEVDKLLWAPNLKVRNYETSFTLATCNFILYKLSLHLNSQKINE